ncbi:MAG: hypothetical protein EBU90_27410, partial [Proteobacteria bacterium]|nr:hypothetical protein [Pseudomonadota bacterium]
GENSVAIGQFAGYYTSGYGAVSIGVNAGFQDTGGDSAVSIGNGAGTFFRRDNAIGIGKFAGQNSQLTNAIALGAHAGQTGQAESSVAIGAFAGSVNQKSNSIAIGAFAGSNLQGSGSVAIGFNAGVIRQSSNSVAIGFDAGYTGQGNSSVAIGVKAAYTGQGNGCVHIGREAGAYGTPQNFQIGIGEFAGATLQGQGAIAIGLRTGGTNQGQQAIAIGYNTAQWNQGAFSIAIGRQAGYTGQGTGGIAIGTNAGFSNQGINAIAIGCNAGLSNQHSNTIILNATGTALNSEASNRTYIRPIRETEQIDGKILHYDKNSGELKYSNNVSHIENVDMVNLRVSNSLDCMTGVLFASATGFVGIGTSTPAVRLDIFSTGTDCQARLEGATRAGVLLKGAGKQWQFESGGGNVGTGSIGIVESGIGTRFICYSGGNIGIGTSASTTPTEKLEVAGNVKTTGTGGIIMNPGGGAGSLVISRSGQFTNNVLGFEPYQDNSIGLSSGGGAQITMGKNELSFSTYAPTGSLGLINPIERMKITSTGIGINQPNPVYKLQVEGSTTSTSGSEVLGWFNNQTGTSQVAFRIGAKTAYIQNHSGLGGITFTDQLSNALSFGVGSSVAPIQLFNGSPAAARLTILSDATGSIGIRTSAPTSILDVNGDTFRLRTARTPASSGAAGNTGDICWDTNYMYVCVNTNTWKRTALSTWS